MPMVFTAVFTMALATGPAGGSAELQAKVEEIFEESCTMCHDDTGDPSEPEGLDLSGDLTRMINQPAVGMDSPLIVPGDPDASYLLIKIHGKGKFEGELMPPGEKMPPDQIQAIADWIRSMPEDAGPPAPPDMAIEESAEDGAPVATAPARGVKPFHGTNQVVLPTTTTLGKKTLQYRIDHRFGRIGTERGFFGLDAGVVMSLGIAYGILDGWDVLIRRSNSRKSWEFATKYVPLRQEDDWPVSLGAYVSMDVLADFDVANRVSGNFMVMLSRLWFERWSTMITFSAHLPTNHNARVLVDFKDGAGPVPVEDTRGTMNIGFASTVWLGKKKRWGIDLEYFQPIPDPGKPNIFYYRGGDADPGGTPIGAWSVGASYAIGKHFFQLFFTNNREIHPNLAAPGGQTVNPFNVPGQDFKNPLNEANFFLGFNLGRRFNLGRNVEKWKKRRKEKKEAQGLSTEAEAETEETEEEAAADDESEVKADKGEAKAEPADGDAPPPPPPPPPPEAKKGKGRGR